MKGISALIKGNPESSLAPSLTWEHSEKMAVSEPGGRPSLTTQQICRHFDLGLPSFENYENFLLFKPLSLWYSVIAARIDRWRVSTKMITECSYFWVMGLWSFVFISYH